MGFSLVTVRFAEWMAALEARHLTELTFPEVSRALRALSSVYVERRARIGSGEVLNGAGKRAAFALFYAPLHFLVVQHIVRSLSATTGSIRTLVDLGCGTGVAGAAWAQGWAHPPRIVGIDRNAWALGEAAWTYRHFALRGLTRQADAARSPFPKPPGAIVAAFTLNELPEAARDELLQRLLHRPSGDRVLIVEPLARGAARWWERWRERFEAVGGRADEWRFSVDLPGIVAKLDRAAGLDHRELVGRSMYLQRPFPNGSRHRPPIRAGDRAASS